MTSMLAEQYSFTSFFIQSNGFSVLTGPVSGVKITGMIDSELLKIMVCPLTHDQLRQEGDWLVNVKWGVKYPVRQGIPIMLIDEAQLPPGVNSLDELKQKICSQS
jgi:uncharacterized protein